MSAVIFRRNANQYVPNDYLKRVINNCSAAFGAAFSDGKQLLVTSGGKEDCTIENIQETMKAYPDKAITFYLTSSSGAVDMDDVSPHILLSDEEGNPRLAVFVEGNMPGFDKKDSSHPPTTHFISDWLVPKINKIAQFVAEDDKEPELPDILKHLKEDKFRKELLNQFTSRGTLQFMTAEDTFSYDIGDTSKEFEWGWVSNHFGFGKEEPKQEEAPKAKANMFAKKSTVREPAPVNQTKPEPIAASQVAQNLKANGNVKVTPKYSVATWTADKTMSRKNRRNAYANRIGYIPEGADDDQPVTIQNYVDQTGALVPWSEVKKLGLLSLGLPPLQNPPRMGDNKNTQKDTETHEVESPEQPVGPKVSADILPIMGPRSRERVNAFMDRPEIKKIITEKGDIVATAEEAKAMEAKVADYIVQLGNKNLKLTDFMRLPYEELIKLMEADPRAFVLLAWNWKNICAHHMAKGLKKTSAEDVQPMPTDAPQPEAEPEAQPEVQPEPEKKAPANMFAKKKVA